MKPLFSVPHKNEKAPPPPPALAPPPLGWDPLPAPVSVSVSMACVVKGDVGEGLIMLTRSPIGLSVRLNTRTHRGVLFVLPLPPVLLLRLSPLAPPGGGAPLC